MNFKEKVQQMTAKEIILAMTASLKRPPRIRINMDTYGEVGRHWTSLFLKPVCFGCAATNTICQIGDVTFTPENIGTTWKRAEAVGLTTSEDRSFLKYFEGAINSLRLGDIYNYNRCAEYMGFAKIEKFASLPKLYNDYTNTDLKAYINFANTL